jgi:hypothetical protein
MTRTFFPDSADGSKRSTAPGANLKQVVGETRYTFSWKKFSQSLRISECGGEPIDCYGTRSNLPIFHSTRMRTHLAPLFNARVAATWTAKYAANTHERCDTLLAAKNLTPS